MQFVRHLMSNLIIFLLLFFLSCTSTQEPIKVIIIPGPEQVNKVECIEYMEKAYEKGFFDAQTHNQ